MAIRVRVNREVALGAEIAAAPLRRRLADAVRTTFRDQDVSDGELSLTLLDDAAMAALNERWLGHAGPTDVIAFALHADGDAPLGDVYVGVPAARRQAGEHGIGVPEELVRLAVHGTLHVLGHDHPEGEDRVGSPMWDVQERIVSEVLAS